MIPSCVNLWIACYTKLQPKCYQNTKLHSCHWSSSHCCPLLNFNFKKSTKYVYILHMFTIILLSIHSNVAEMIPRSNKSHEVSHKKDYKWHIYLHKWENRVASQRYWFITQFAGFIQFCSSQPAGKPELILSQSRTPYLYSLCLQGSQWSLHTLLHYT